MDNIEHKRGKIYYSMGEVAEMFDVKPSLIRFWEKKFDILKPHKNKKGNRMFTPEDVDNFRMIYHLVKEKGMTLEGARLRMRGDSSEELTRNMEIIDRLQRVKALLMDVKQSLKVGEGISDDYWERDDEPVIDVEEQPESVASVPEQVGPQEPPVENSPVTEPLEEDVPWIDEPAPVPAQAAEEDPEDESEEAEDDEFGFGRRDEDIPDPFEYEPAEDYSVEPATAAEPASQPGQPEAAESSELPEQSEPADQPKQLEEPGQPEEPGLPGPAADAPAPRPRRKRAAKSSGTLRLDDDVQEQAPKPRFIEQTLF